MRAAAGLAYIQGIGALAMVSIALFGASLPAFGIEFTMPWQIAATAIGGTVGLVLMRRSRRA